jgi:phage gp46-like protein
MSQDVKLEKDADGVFDLVEEDGDIASVDGLETAIITSLFTDARTSSGEVPAAYSRRGFSGNLLRIDDDYELGSELWLLEQARLEQNTLNRAQDFAYKSLVWMITKGLAENIEVNVIIQGVRGAYIRIDLFKAKNLVARYITIWRSTSGIG